MKKLLLGRDTTGKKSGKFLYTVRDEDGTLLATRSSNREYVACYVEKGSSGNFSLPYFFGRMDLVGKGDSQRCKPYALATLITHK